MTEQELTLRLRMAREEVSAVLASLDLVIRKGPQKRFPPRYCSYLWHALNGQIAPLGVDVKFGIGHAIRQIHDFYGWMAKPGKVGGCAGALYRSEAFLELDVDARDGRKGATKNVHIEHLVPVSALEKGLKAMSGSFQSASALYAFLMDHSICVAMTQAESTMIHDSGVSRSTSPAFDSKGNKTGEHPFRRYSPAQSDSERSVSALRIYNVITQSEVNFATYSFDRHRETLQIAGETSAAGSPSVFSWDVFRDG
jgi:hypothetical protein